MVRKSRSLPVLRDGIPRFLARERWGHTGVHREGRANVSPRPHSGNLCEKSLTAEPSGTMRGNPAVAARPH